MACRQVAPDLRQLVAEITLSTKAILHIEPKELHDIRTGTFAVGTNNQYFTNLDFVNGMLRDQSMYTWYPLLLTFQDERFTLEQCCALVHRFDYAYSNYLRYSGLQEMGAFAEAITKYLPTAGSRDEAVEAVKAFLGYLNRLAAWSFHYFLGASENISLTRPRKVPSRPWPIPLGVFRSATVKRYGLPGAAGHQRHCLSRDEGKPRTLQRPYSSSALHGCSGPCRCQR
ncbi:hypothetical protein AGRHK599_LOCUS5117 [Rhizobium rhizogenes]|uniref:Cucumopine synthase C-terminal helical bundle domain-containing protein n=1 Tax=Rhizobium rhizogenes TaxID=359 RepID=A0AAN2AAI5_RHIRH|nr:hypothetical protein [Rhizobium rhizogenes]CAD0217564.1 hypothetical protein AGRHK599_LOCUS5117 [Rhizobium rhizogenes]